MKNLLFGLAALPFLTSVALAAKPLSDAQMDRVTAGQVTTRRRRLRSLVPPAQTGEILHGKPDRAGVPCPRRVSHPNRLSVTITIKAVL